jgi:dTDP-glucose pyrophosphorylase
MGAISAHYAKPVLPVCNEPLISIHLRHMASLGVQKTVVVVGHQKESVKAVARTSCSKGMKLRFVEQEERLGIAHALGVARPEVGEANLVVILGDTHFTASNLALGLDKLEGRGNGSAAAVLSVRRVGDPRLIRRECTVRFDFDGRLLEIREKPELPFNDMKPCGVYFFSPAIFEAIEVTRPTPLRGEVEISDSIQTLVEMGLPVTWAPTIAWDRNINYPGDILMSNLVELRARKLKLLVGPESQVHPEAVLKDTVVGRGAAIRTPARLHRTLVLDGAEIDEHGSFKDCIIGPGFTLTDCLRDEWADTPT